MTRAELRTDNDAVSFYRSISDSTAKAILDFLIDHPDERFNGADLVGQLGLQEHRAVARSTYRMGQIAAELGLQRPWTESQQGYLMPTEAAELLREARAQSGAVSQS